MKKILISDEILFINFIDFWPKIKSPKLDANVMNISQEMN